MTIEHRAWHAALGGVPTDRVRVYTIDGIQVLDDDGNELAGRLTMSLDMSPAILVLDFGVGTISAKETACKEWVVTGGRMVGAKPIRFHSRKETP